MMAILPLTISWNITFYKTCEINGWMPGKYQNQCCQNIILNKITDPGNTALIVKDVNLLPPVRCFHIILFSKFCLSTDRPGIMYIHHREHKREGSQSHRKVTTDGLSILSFEYSVYKQKSAAASTRRTPVSGGGCTVKNENKGKKTIGRKSK